MSHAAPPHATEPAEPKRARQRTFLGMFSAAVREIELTDVILLLVAVPAVGGWSLLRRR